MPNKIHEYAEKLTATLPEPLKCVYFVNSGSEANDMAMMMAREYSGNFDILSFRNSYHGNSSEAKRSKAGEKRLLGYFVNCHKLDKLKLQSSFPGL